MNKLELLRQYTDLQADDETIWLEPKSASEAHILRELRKLIWLIEEATENQIRTAIKELKEQLNG